MENAAVPPQEWLDSLRQRADDMMRQSQEVQEQLQDMHETASEAGVSVTVSANGALRDLDFDRGALHRGAAELRSTILRLAGQAQARVAHRVTEAVTPISGTEGAEFLRSQLPADPDEGRSSSPPSDVDDEDEPPESFLR